MTLARQFINIAIYLVYELRQFLTKQQLAIVGVMNLLGLLGCGQSNGLFNRIHNGNVSSRGEFPWVAAIYHLDGSQKWKQVCGGTLVSPSLVLTGKCPYSFHSSVNTSSSSQRCLHSIFNHSSFLLNSNSIISTGIYYYITIYLYVSYFYDL